MPAHRLVVLTRERADNVALARRLEEAGIEVLDYPCIETRFLPVDGAALAAPHGLEACAAVVFTSRRGVEAIAGAAVDWDRFPGLVAAVGEGTARTAERVLGRVPEVVSTDGTGATLGRMLGERLHPGGVVLHVRGRKTTGHLQAALVEAGLNVVEEVVYENASPALKPLDGVPDGAVAVFASPSAARRFFGANEALCGRIRPVAIGPTTAAALAEMGCDAAAVAVRPELEELTTCILDLVGR
jgi:uroporphyrinogen-III synthase